ncbi:MAG: hypothetical protein HWD86_02455 [Kangiellaceae bacterium]|nr:hypothetical protein [Kangiellaceae bacterium]
MTLETLLTIGGIFHLVFLLFHLMFWKLFKWESQLKKLHPINKGAMRAMNIILIAIFAIFAVISLGFQEELLTSRLGFFLIVSIASVWLLRTIIQIPLFTLQAVASKVFFITTLIGASIYAYIGLALYKQF